ncbi:MAG: CoA transferase [Dehalococcoidia bacterium]
MQRARQQVLDLMVKNVDVLIRKQYCPRVMPNFQLDYETLKAVNPKLVMCSISGFGATGPHAHYVAAGSRYLKHQEAWLHKQDMIRITDLYWYRQHYIADPMAGTLCHHSYNVCCSS